MVPIKQQTEAYIDKMLMPVLTGVILPFIEASPIFQASLLSAYGMFWIYMQYNQNKLNEFINILKENPWIFTEEIVKTEEFKDGFLVIMEWYLKERSAEKRKIIKNIFLGFTELSESEKNEFELEKLLEIVKNISTQEIDYLKHLYYDVKPFQDKYINHENSLRHHEYGDLIKEKPLTSFIHKLKKLYSFKDAYDNISENDYSWYINWLVSLNILLPFYKDGLKPEFDFTTIWKKFIKYILE